MILLSFQKSYYRMIYAGIGKASRLVTWWYVNCATFNMFVWLVARADLL
jgi:hypothetical protein